MPVETLDIGIAGAGIGGLAVAALLARDGHRVQLFDQFDAPRPVGSGLVIQPVGQRALELVGAADSAWEFGAPIRRMIGHEVNSGRRVLDVSYGRANAADRGLAIHRASLFQVLLDAARREGVTPVTGAKVVGVSAAALLFESGHREGPFDLIIDASGAGSPLAPTRITPLPYGAIWGTVDWPAGTPLAADELSQRYRRADRMVGVLPVGRLPGSPEPKAAIFWSLPRDGHQAWLAGGLDLWQSEATRLWPDFAPFLRQITDPAQMTMARYGHGTLRRPFEGRVAFIGDAAHRTSPQLGQGANMALLDAAALARALARHPVEDALRAYTLARRWHVRIYQWMSAAFTPQYQSDSRMLPVLRDRLLFPLSQIPPIPRVLTSLVIGRMLPPLGSLSERGSRDF